MISPIQRSKLDATKIDTKSAIFAYIMNKLKHANGFIDMSYTDSDMLHNEMDIIFWVGTNLHLSLHAKTTIFKSARKPAGSPTVNGFLC